MTPANRTATLAALAVAATPPGSGPPGLTVATGTVPAAAAVAPHTASASAIDWAAIAAEQNAKDGLRRDQHGVWGRNA